MFNIINNMNILYMIKFDKKFNLFSWVSRVNSYIVYRNIFMGALNRITIITEGTQNQNATHYRRIPPGGRILYRAIHETFLSHFFSFRRLM